MEIVVSEKCGGIVVCLDFVILYRQLRLVQSEGASGENESLVSSVAIKSRDNILFYSGFSFARSRAIIKIVELKISI